MQQLKKPTQILKVGEYKLFLKSSKQKNAFNNSLKNNSTTENAFNNSF